MNPGPGVDLGATSAGSGAIGGLGHAAAKIFANGGADMIIASTDPDRGAEVVEDVRASGGGRSPAAAVVPG